MYRDLLVHVDGSEAARRRVQFAVDLAQRTGARLSGLHVTPPTEVPPRYKPSQVDGIAAKLSTELAEDAGAAATIFAEEAAQNLSDTRWFETGGDIADGISEKARYADLVIVGQYEWQGTPQSHPLPVAHPVVLQCGRPVLVVPASLGPRALARIGIAWDASREAVRAVHDALPLLHLAQSVEIVAISDPVAGDAALDAKSLSAHLAHHGIAVETKNFQIGSSEENESLRNRIEQGHYDLLVMGGYSHPVWFEFIFGGATRSILLSSTIPILVSH
jgi:nucleotide-binding universal stress UspA family protein